MKLEKFTRGEGWDAYMFWCPGCKTNHLFDVRTDGGHPNWTFNGDMERPTFSPSLHYPTQVCHLFLRDGAIQFLGDCTHELAGKTVALADIDE